MAIAADRVSRGLRFQQIQEALGDDNTAFAERLNRVASELGLDRSWYSVRVSKVRTGVQDLSLDDAAVLEAIDPGGHSWHWIAFGVERLPQLRGVKLERRDIPATRARAQRTVQEKKKGA